MTEGAIHEMSRMLGELVAGVRALDAKIDIKIDALDDRMTGHHAEADKRWDRLDSELRTIKHDARGVEMKVEGLYEGQRRMGDKLGPLEKLPDAVAAVDKRVAAVEVVNAKVENLDVRLGTIERLAYKLAGVAAAVAAAVTIIGPILIHWGGEFARWLTGKH